MEKKQVLILGAGGAAGIAALAAAAWALTPGPRGLAGLDFNQDGRIVRAEIQQGARQRFAELDRNNDGRLVADELPRGPHGRGHGRHGERHDRFGPEAPPPQAAAADANGDGALDLREFYADFSARSARADADRDGIVSAEELAAHRPGRRGRRHGG